METIHEKIKRLRIEKRINQIELANSIGVSRSAYILIENGSTKSISIELGKRLAKELGVSFNELFEVENPDLDNAQKELVNVKTLYNKQLVTEKDLREVLEFSRKESKAWLERLDLVDWFHYIDNELFEQENKAIVSGRKTFEVFPMEVVNDFYRIYGDNAKEEILKYIDLDKYSNSNYANKARKNEKVTANRKDIDGNVSEIVISYADLYKNFIEKVLEAKKSLQKENE